MPDQTAPRPGIIELYLLAAGLLLGVLLGPAVLGRVSPTGYATLFGGGAMQTQLETYDEETTTMLAALADTGVTPIAVGEQLALRQSSRELMQQSREALMDLNAFGKITSFLLLLAVWLFLQSAVGGRFGAGWRVATGLVALAIAVLIARPSILTQHLLWSWIG